MKSWHWAQVLGTLFGIPFSAGQGTTISIGISYCPPSGTIPLPQPTIGPLAPYYLFVAEGLGGPFSYIDTQGHLTDISDAAQFIFTSGGQLTVGSEIVARNGTAVTQPLAIGPNTGSVSTTFSPENGLLRWRNNAFEGGEASFCKTNDTVIVSFNGILPNDCRPTLIGLLLVSSLFGQPMSSSSRTDLPSLTYSTTSSLPGSSIASLATTLGTTVLTSTLISLTESLTSILTSSSFGGFNSVSITTSTNDLSTGNNPSSTNPVSAPGSSNGGSTSSFASLATTVTNTNPLNSITLSPTTTTASPSVSLITSLQTDTASTDSVIDSALSTSTETASTTITSTDQFSSTELVSTLPTPPVTSTTTDIAPTLTISNPIVTSSIDSTSDSTSEFPTSNDIITTTDTASPTSNTLTIVTDPIPSSPNPTTEITITDIFPNPSTSDTIDTTTSTSATLVISSSITTTRTPTDTSCPILPLNSNALCPQQSGASYKLDEDSFCYGILCSTSLAGTVITANSTTANTLRGCAAYCALFNNAIPYSCLGISYLGSAASSGASNCLLYGQITSELEGSDGVDSVRLIYPGYPVVQKRDRYAAIGDED